MISVLGYVQMKKKKLRLQEHRELLQALEKKHQADLALRKMKNLLGN